MRNKASLALSAGAMLLSGAGVIAALDWPLKAKLFPLAIGIPLFFLAGAEALWSLLKPSSGPKGQDMALTEDVPRDVALRRTAAAALWMLGFFAAIVLFGFPAAVPLFVFAYLVVQGREGWIFSAIFSALVWAAFYGLFDRLLHLPFATGLVQDALGGLL